jgi:type IV secretory pathway TraG/TraD family ATPase VirD4
MGRDSRGERLVALSSEAARHHVAVVGPTGSGKSSLIGRSILSDIHQGFGGVVIDPKSDLVEDLLRRVDPRDADRIVVIDPSDTSRPTPGLDVLGAGDPDLRADVLLGALTSLFKSSSGIRTETYGRLALRTLAGVPGATLGDMGRLFADAAYRRAAIARVRDPFIRSQWAAFESLSAAAQMEHVQSPLSKVTALVSRPAIRSVLAAPEPTIDVGRLLAERRWLFVSLAPGRLGEPGARLLGATVMYMVWSAVEARAALPAEERHPLFIYVDELSTIAALPFGLEQLLERARGLGAGITVVVQNLARIPESTRAALLGNVATLVSYRAPADEARRLAREMPGLTDRDLQALGAFELAARVGVGIGSEVAVVTGRSLPWPEQTGMADVVRDRSAENYGAVPVEEVSEAEIAGDESPAIGRTRRSS